MEPMQFINVYNILRTENLFSDGEAQTPAGCFEQGSRDNLVSTADLPGCNPKIMELVSKTETSRGNVA